MKLPLFKFKAISMAYRREKVFMILVAIFLATVTMMNLLGVSKFVSMSFNSFGLDWEVLLPVGLLPYPITFLCTDLCSELFGYRKAKFMVFAGLIANIWIFVLLWTMGGLPYPTEAGMPLSPEHPEYAFYQIRYFAMGSMGASITAYFVAQYLDVRLYEYFREWTQGKHLWLRNTFSTLISQWVDTMVVIGLTYLFIQNLPLETDRSLHQILEVMVSCYLFKAIMALLDTGPLYLLIHLLKKYLGEDKRVEKYCVSPIEEKLPV